MEDDVSMTEANLTAALAECYRLTGADPDGNDDRALAPYAVLEVTRLRDELDEVDEANVALRAEVKRLRDGIAWLTTQPADVVEYELPRLLDAR